MDIDYESTALYGDVPIDNRCLSLAVEFYKLSRKQAESIAEEVIMWLLELCPKERFVSVHRRHNDRSSSIKKILSELHDLPTNPLFWIYSFDAYVTSDIVYNKKTMAAYTKSIEYGVLANIAMKSNPFSVSIDYQKCWENLFSVGEKNDSQLKERFLALFREKGKISKQLFHDSDVDAAISITPYEKNQELHYGTIKINFSAFCLKQNLTIVAQKFSAFAEHLSSYYCNLNARVMLQPKCTVQSSPYKLYFGADGSVDDSHLERNYTENEWYSSYYLPGVEWMNIISPLAREHLPCLQRKVHTQADVCVKQLSCGSVVVKADIAIDKYDIDQALILKQLLYPALYPGRSVFPLKLLFGNPKRGALPIPYIRKNWEIVPVFEDELDIVSTYLVFAFSENRKTESGFLR